MRTNLATAFTLIAIDSLAFAAALHDTRGFVIAIFCGIAALAIIRS